MKRIMSQGFAWLCGLLCVLGLSMPDSMAQANQTFRVYRSEELAFEVQFPSEWQWEKMEQSEVLLSQDKRVVIVFRFEEPLPSLVSEGDYPFDQWTDLDKRAFIEELQKRFFEKSQGQKSPLPFPEMKFIALKNHQGLLIYSPEEEEEPVILIMVPRKEQTLAVFLFANSLGDFQKYSTPLEKIIANLEV